LDDRRALKRSGARGRVAVELLSRPDRLLTAILFWNLVINVTYFTIGSIIGVQLEHSQRHGEAATVAVVTLLGLIVLAEMIPKTIGVQLPRVLAKLVSLPIAAAVRALDPMMPVLAAANRLLGRLVAPNFAREPYLEINDLERAITLSTPDAHLAARERLALQNIVLLSDLSAEELMRPRRNLVVFPPPVSLDQVRKQAPSDGYVLVTEPDSEEIAGAIPLKYLPTAPRQKLEQFARPVVYVPWCATAAAAFDELQRHERDVAVVVNELGETIGIITEDDIVETAFEEDASRSERLLAVSSLAPLGGDRWRATGITNLRRLGRHFDVPLEPAVSVTVGGLLQELLQRIPVEGDEVSWSGFDFRVMEAPPNGPLRVEVKLSPGGGPLP
jgi:CBS domain containing-hemolysin-like protein